MIGRALSFAFLFCLACPAFADVYQCPMKCEGAKTYEAPQKCPVCGMDIVKLGAPRPSKLKMQISPDPLVPGKSVRLELTPVAKSDGAIKPLDLVYGQAIQLILVSQDLSWFKHLTPTAKKGGSFVQELKLPQSGNYLGVGEFKPKEEPGQVSFLPLQVPGKSAPAKPLSLSRIWKESDFKVELETPAHIEVGEVAVLRFKLSQKGKPIPLSSLEPYLGELGQCVAFIEDLTEYVRASMTGGAFPGDSSELSFDAVFPKAGTYKIWMELKHRGTVRAPHFVIRIR